MKLSSAQYSALHRIAQWAEDGSYMPFVNEQRTFEALEKKGLVKYGSINEGFRYNGYRFTEAGKKLHMERK